MSKKKLTVTDLIAKKEQLTSKKKSTKELYIEQLDATVTIETPDRSLVLEAIEMGQDKNIDSNGDDFLVYNIVVEPNLKDVELQKIYECKEPIDIVTKIFDIGTVAGIAQEAMKLAGFTSTVTPVDEIKN